MRGLIEQRLARRRSQADPRQRALANVIGPVSPAYLAALDASRERAAVLLALIERPQGLQVLFTERAAHLKHHAGQISFPGGRIEAAGESAVDAALREAHEEIGLPPGEVTVAGCLDPHITGTGFSVTPVVGFVAAEFAARPDPGEVRSVFEAPLEFFLAPEAARETHLERFGCRIRMFEFHYAGRVIWGATAAMLVTLGKIIKDE